MNCYLITPSETLSEQHLADLAESGIPACRFDLGRTGLWSCGQNTVQVIEITKLVEEKRGGGVCVPVEAFEGKNLIFVDEGHKGSGGEVWRKYRDALGATGFTFEYSATFGQALSAARNDALTTEYGKAIAFDYSYRYFYGDGFGKDFRVLNLKQETHEEQTETLLLGGLLSFYEQLRVFEDHMDSIQPYNLEKPLWVFVGSTVNAVYSEEKRKRSDVLTVARFLHHVLENKNDWVIEGIQKLLEANSGLVKPDETDLFAERFSYLREKGSSPQALYADILKRLFHAQAGGGLRLCDIRDCPGELGLKLAGADDYFGLIYIGDKAEFKKLVEEDNAGITLEEDAISQSLFEDINKPNSRINILIGAKKFMEGWNSWRVSNMGLLNIGRQEGSQIIQLFGRGVRLKGKNYSLKRSTALEDHRPPHIHLLETLDIFAVRANYMALFREYLEREGLEIEEPVQLLLPIWPNECLLNKGLLVPRVPENCDFSAEESLVLLPDPNVQANVDMSIKVQVLESAHEKIKSPVVAQQGCEQPIPEECLEWVDWERAYLDLLEYKQRKRMTNLIVRSDVPRKIIEYRTPDGEHVYHLTADESIAKPRSFSERKRLQEIVTAILCKYADEFYRVRREQWESHRMTYRLLDETDENLNLRPQGARESTPAYVVRIPRSKRDLISTVEKLIDDVEKLRRDENSSLPRICFDRHLYLPLLQEVDDKSRSSIPPALKPSEARFVRDLKNYWLAEKDESLAGTEVFLLRNLTRGKGIGFFEERSFYPDFILWTVSGDEQCIVFVEPHGMIHAKAYVHDEKARLHETLPELAREIGKRSRRQGITLDSYIISATPYDDLRKKYEDGTWDREKFAEKHILFMERTNEYEYLKMLFSGIMARLR